jgi:WD40 repeat protein/tRNA A-37 threonylcarbamoyl transferase component Bud32
VQTDAVAETDHNEDHLMPDSLTLDTLSGVSRTEMVGLIRAHQRRRWQLGDRISVEDYLQRFVQLRSDGEALLDLVYSEVLLREEHGETVRVEDYQARFPEHSDSLARQFALHQALADSGDLSQVTRGRLTSPPIRGTPTVPGYAILAELGRGAMGVVYRARQIKADRIVALKMMLGEFAEDSDRNRFQTEIEAIARVRHPQVVPVFEVGEVDGEPFFSMEYCEGGSLSARLTNPLPAGEAARLVEQIAQGVAAAHAVGIIHRDLKPANVLLQTIFTTENTENKEKDQINYLPKVTDFGLAKKLDDVSQTTTGAVLGTPPYMSPEQAAGLTHATCPATDIYALGAILYECLTGRPPFKAATPVDTLWQVINDEPVSPRRLNRGVPRDLETICLKCLHKDPRQRYATAGDLADELRRFIDGRPITARPVGVLGRLGRWAKRHPLPALLSLAVVLALVAGTTVSLIFAALSDENARRHQESALLAQTETTEKERQRQQAVHKEKQRRVEAERAEQQLYFARIGLARRDWDDALLAEAEHHLGLCPPPLRHWEHGYLSRLCRGTPFVISGLDDNPLSIQFDREGTRLLSAGSDRLVRIWDAVTGKETLVLRGHTEAVAMAVFSPDGRRVASVSVDKSLRVWNAETGDEILRVDLTGRASCVAYSPDGRKLLVSSGDPFKVGQPGRVELFDASTGKLLLALVGHSDMVLSVAFTLEGDRIATGGYDRTVRLWNVENGRETGIYRGHTGAVQGVCFSPDGRRLASVSTDQTVKVIDTVTGQETLSLRGHVGFVREVAFSPDGQRIASGGSDHTVRVWDATSGEELFRLRAHADHVTGLAYCRDGRRLATIGNDRTIKVWNARVGPEAAVLASQDKQVRCLAFSPNGDRLAMGSGDGTIKVFDPKSDGELFVCRGHTNTINDVAFSPDGLLIGSGAGDLTAKIYDGRTGQELLTYRGHQRGLTGLAFHPDGRRVATAGGDALVKIWNPRTGDEVLTIKAPTWRLQRLAFSPDGQRLAVGCDNLVKVWDSNTGGEVATFAGHTKYVSALTFSPDGRSVASAGNDRIVKIWQAATGEEQMSLKGHAGAVSALAFSSDGLRLASAGHDRTVKLWDTRTGQEVFALPGHAEPIIAMSWSRDGRRIATGCGSVLRVFE